MYIFFLPPPTLLGETQQRKVWSKIIWRLDKFLDNCVKNGQYVFYFWYFLARNFARVSERVQNYHKRAGDFRAMTYKKVLKLKWNSTFLRIRFFETKYSSILYIFQNSYRKKCFLSLSTLILIIVLALVFKNISFLNF